MEHHAAGAGGVLFLFSLFGRPLFLIEPKYRWVLFGSSPFVLEFRSVCVCFLIIDLSTLGSSRFTTGVFRWRALVLCPWCKAFHLMRVLLSHFWKKLTGACRWKGKVRFKKQQKKMYFLILQDWSTMFENTVVLLFSCLNVLWRSKLTGQTCLWSGVELRAEEEKYQG